MSELLAQFRAGAYNKYLAGLLVTLIGYLNQKFGWRIELHSDEALAFVGFIIANVMMLVGNKQA